MSAEDNKAAIRRFFEEVVNQGNVQTVDEIFAPHFVLHDPFFYGPREGSPDDVKNIVEKLRTAFPDVHVTVDDQIADENDSVVTRWTGTGTHEGEIDSIKSSHVKVEFYGTSISHFSAGKIDETQNAMVDRLGSLKDRIHVPPQDECNWFCHICPRCCR